MELSAKTSACLHITQDTSITELVMVRGFFWETTVHDDTSPYVAMGYLDGVCSMYNAANGFANGIAPQCGDARWLVLGGNYSTKFWAAMRLT